ncbi:unnamed protein product, partial [Prunus brigantina]
KKTVSCCFCFGLQQKVRAFSFSARSQLKKDEGLTTHKPLPSLSRTMSLFGLGRQRTFRPKKSAPSGSKVVSL